MMLNHSYWTHICDKNIMFCFCLCIQKAALRPKQNYRNIYHFGCSIYSYCGTLDILQKHHAEHFSCLNHNISEQQAMKTESFTSIKAENKSSQIIPNSVWCWDRRAANLYLPLSAAPPCRVDLAEIVHGGDWGVVGWHSWWTFLLLVPDCAVGSLASPAALNLW